jgi:hypothetical protein
MENNSDNLSNTHNDELPVYKGIFYTSAKQSPEVANGKAHSEVFAGLYAISDRHDSIGAFRYALDTRNSCRYYHGISLRFGTGGNQRRSNDGDNSYSGFHLVRDDSSPKGYSTRL